MSAPTTLRPLRIGPYTSATPVVLAPMAGITNAGFRRLCREQGAGFYVCEMITSRGLVEKNPLTRRMIAFGADESPRSMQLYGVDPVAMGRAVQIVAEEGLADHIDMNFGCPVPKVTRKGGGAALPYKRRLFERIVTAAVDNAGDIPVTVKMRIGIDDERHTFLDAGRRAVDAGAVAVALHARTAAQRYSGQADWSAIARLRDALPAEIPVLGNGDIFSAADALRMLAQTGCSGVVIGRGCLGRPWLFGALEAALTGRAVPPTPTLGVVTTTLLRHGRLLTEHLGRAFGRLGPRPALRGGAEVDAVSRYQYFVVCGAIAPRSGTHRSRSRQRGFRARVAQRSCDQVPARPARRRTRSAGGSGPRRVGSQRRSKGPGGPLSHAVSVVHVPGRGRRRRSVDSVTEASGSAR